jgi:hypothetical protein
VQIKNINDKLIIPSSSPSSSSGPPALLIADSGSTGNYVSSNFPVLNVIPTNKPIHITIPDGSTLTSTHEGILDFPLLSPAARHVHIFPALHHCSLLSIGQLCDAGYTVTFDATIMQVSDMHQTVLLTGQRSHDTGLWHVPMPTPIPHVAHHTVGPRYHMAARALGTPATAEQVAYAHATLFSPALSTLEKALARGFLTNFPGLTLDHLRKHPPRSIAMHKGHMDQSRQNQRSTKTDIDQNAINDLLFPIDDDDHEDISPTHSGVRTHFCYVNTVNTGQIYTDQTGRFITPSTTGNNYIMILYDYDSNSIFAQPYANKTSKCLLDAYKKLHNRLVIGGLRPKLQRLDNECSIELKDYMTEEGVEFQLVPPAVHRRNAAERAIRTFANHFIAGLCSTDANFPLHLWDQLLPQAEITLNLMRGSRVNPNLSAFAQIAGSFDFNCNPLGPPGTFVLAHEKPINRTTWSPHALEGWYVGPALDSYRCYRVWIIETRDTRIIDTLEWFPKHVPMPASGSNDRILAALKDILHALRHPSPATPLAPRTDSQTQAITDLVTLLTKTCTVDDTSDAITLPLPRVPINVTTEPIAELPTLPSDALPRVPLATIPEQIDTPSIPLDVPATYNNMTGPRGRRHRRTQRRNKQAIAPTAAPTATVPRRSARTPKPKVPFAAATTSSSIAPVSAYGNIPLVAFHGTAINPDTGRVAEYRELSKCSTGSQWQNGNCNEIGRLFQGLGPDSHMPTGTNTCEFIFRREIPDDAVVTYIRVVCADRPEKEEPERVRWTAGGDKIVVDENVSTETADVIVVKLLINSILSTPKARAVCSDLKDFYLGNDLSKPEFVRIPVWMLPQSIIDLYQLEDKIVNGYVYARVTKGMYGLPQAGKLANDRLREHLAPYGYVPCPHTHGLWMHLHSDLQFTLVVDDFFIKYTDRAQADTLLRVLEQKYVVKTDWTASRYIGLTIGWNYHNRTADISMPGYVARALQRFEHPAPIKPEHSPHEWIAPLYGSRQQYAKTLDTAPVVDAKTTTRIQQVLGTLLYYARAVDCSMLVAIGTLATQQAHATEHTVAALTQLLNYCATHPDATIRFHASDMILHIESDASYLSETKSRSRAAGFFYLSSTPCADNNPPPYNGPIAVQSVILKEVVSSAAEAELAALFYNGKEACPIRVALQELGHDQPATPIVTDNSTASGIINDTVKQKRSKAMDMRFYWIRDRVRQGQFKVYWQRGITNKADYFTKHHARTHHSDMRNVYFQPPSANRNYYACLDDDKDKHAANSTHAAYYSSSESTADKGVLIAVVVRRPDDTFSLADDDEFSATAATTRAWDTDSTISMATPFSLQ